MLNLFLIILREDLSPIALPNSDYRVFSMFIVIELSLSLFQTYNTVFKAIEHVLLLGLSNHIFHAFHTRNCVFGVQMNS
jgi:hypothetical protein